MILNGFYFVLGAVAAILMLIVLYSVGCFVLGLAWWGLCELYAWVQRLFGGVAVADLRPLKSRRAR